jgi:hypothetical protein
MNDRIQELVSQAQKSVQFLSNSAESKQSIMMEKFAELIVRECAKRIDYWESRQGEHCDDLLKHFGVTK